MLWPCSQEIKTRWDLSERSPTLAHSLWEEDGKTKDPLGACQRLGEDIQTHAHTCTGVHTSLLRLTHKEREGKEILTVDVCCQLCGNTASLLLCLIYLFISSNGCDDRATHPQTASPGPKRPFKQQRKNFKSPIPALTILTRVSMYSSCRVHSGG